MLALHGTASSCCFGKADSRQKAQRRLSIAHAKKDIHPKYYDEAKVVCNGEEVLVTSGTMPQYTVDIWSGNHPFYTKSDTTLVTEEGRVSRFNKKFGGTTLGQIASSKPGDKKLDYKSPLKQKKKGGKR